MQEHFDCFGKKFGLTQALSFYNNNKNSNKNNRNMSVNNLKAVHEKSNGKLWSPQEQQQQITNTYFTKRHNVFTHAIAYDERKPYLVILRLTAIFAY